MHLDLFRRVLESEPALSLLMNKMRLVQIVIEGPVDRIVVLNDELPPAILC